MSAVLRWRCDMCHSDAEVVEEVPRGLLSLYSPKMPTGWVRKLDGKRSYDLCSQRCVVNYTHSVLAREQRKLADDAG